MRTFGSLLVLLLCSLIPASLAAQQSISPIPGPAASDPQAVALLQEALAALGADVADVTLTGTAHRIAGSDDETGTATLTALAGGYSKVDLTLSSGPRIEIRNPSGTPLPGAIPTALAASASGSQAVGASSGPDGVLHAIPENDMLTDPAWFFPAFTVARLTGSMNYVLSDIGPEMLNGRAVVHLSAVQQVSTISNSAPQIAALLQHISQMDIYLDAMTLVPVELTFTTHPNDNAFFDVLTEIQFSDYQTVNGVQAPFHVQRYVNYGLALDLQFSGLVLNSGLTAAQFQF